MSININSEATCRKAYLNYHCYGNSMGITDQEMGKIAQAWSNRLESWQTSVSNDENEYEFDDTDYSKYKDEGKERGKEVTGHDGSKGKTITRGAVDALGSAAGALGATVGKKVASDIATKAGGKLLGNAMTKAGEKIAMKTFENTSSTVAEETAKQTASEAASKATKNVSWIITAPMALAIGAAYLAKKPNKEEKEACDALQDEMAGAQSALAETQGEMETMSDEIITRTDEASTINEDANKDIEDKKSEYDMYYSTLMAIQEKVKAGEQLSDSEKALYEEVMTYLSEIGIDIEELSSDTTDEVNELYDEIGTYQDGYDMAAETMGEIEGITDFAESFDSATQTMCYIEAGAQTLNVYTGGKAALDAGKFAAKGGWVTAWAWAFAAMGASGGAISGTAAAEQYNWAGEVGTEIEMRKMTQDINNDTMEIYDEEIDAYDGFMQDVEDLELEIPDDIIPADELSVLAIPESGNTTESNSNSAAVDKTATTDADTKIKPKNKNKEK